MCKLNRDFQKRDTILFTDGYQAEKYLGGIRKFEKLSLDGLKQLLDENFIDPADCQNASPSVQEIFEFMKRYSDYTAHGYAVSPLRDDYRVSLEGVEKEYPTGSRKELEDFTMLFRFADEFSVLGKMYCWYD